MSTGFFAVSISTLHQIADLQGGADHIMAYLVLASHTSGKGSRAHRVSTAGAKAISKKTGISYNRTEKCLGWLCTNDFIERIADGEEGSAPRTPRWLLCELRDNLVYLSHSLIEGVGKGKIIPPLRRIWDDTNTGSCPSFMSAKMDVILLLIHCYQEQQIQDYGGVDPKCIRGIWSESDCLPDSLESMEWLVVEIEKKGNEASISFINRVLPYISSDDQSERFWNAFNNLRNLGFMYEVLQVWHGDPVKDDRAELQYPLYIRDYHARKNEAYCLKETHAFLRDYYDGKGFMETIEHGIENNSFRYIRTKRGGECVLGTMRMRFRPSTEEVAQGLKHEGSRAERWKTVLRNTAEKQSN
ncbi:hypothetical protein LCGC14_0827160 [marine sediment metagenome]|uniref:Uncharacterized protein n=1 Tax=marine sediment metagenome TaxID=412755 RepID=A0A0F9PLQ6_9ZZZZ